MTFRQERRVKAKVPLVWSEGRVGLLVLGLALIFYLMFTTVALLWHSGDWHWFLWLGERYHDLDGDGRLGYDGQFIYYIARDGFASLPHLDNPPYRLQRILYPLVVWGVSLGRVELMAMAMVGVNIAAIAGGTYVLADWLRSRYVSAWYALTFPFYVGTFLAYSRSLNEPLAFALAAAGVTAWFQKQHVRATLFLALALLAKETVVLLVAGLAVAALLQRNWRRWGWLVAAGVPLVLWEAYLYGVFMELPVLAGPGLVGLPLAGIVPHLILEPGRISALLFVGLPALGMLVLAVLKLRVQPTSPALWMLLFNAFLIVLMPLAVYDHIMHAGRNALGLVLAAIFCFPLLGERVRLLLAFGWILPTLIWLIPVLRWAPWLSQI